MQDSLPRSPIRLGPSIARQLATLFSTIGYADALGDPAALAASGFTGAAAQRVANIVSEESALSTLTRLFFLCHEITSTAAERALRPLGLVDLLRVGLLQVRQDRVKAMVRISPHRDLLIPFDAEPRGPDQVHGVAGAALTLSALTIRRPAVNALDLGTGSGFQALLATRHATRVLGTDVNPRAIDLARFGANLNGTHNVRWCVGDWCQPLRRSFFDLIVANPPYVISPESDLRYRDSGALGADLCGQVVAQASDHLTDGGFATIACNWPSGRGDDWCEPAERWVRDCPCDTIVVNYGEEDAVDYAERWNPTEPGGQSTAEREATIRRWVRYYGDLGIEAITFGAVILRRRSNGPNWLHTVRPKTGPVRNASRQLLDIFSGLDHSLSRSDEALMADRFQLTSDYRVQRLGSQLLMGRLGIEATVEPAVVEVLDACEGGAALGDVVGSVSERTGTSHAMLASATTRGIRQLLENGLIRFRDDKTSAREGEATCDIRTPCPPRARSVPVRTGT
jgi:methylase of polypeptide subunit release factors